MKKKMRTAVICVILILIVAPLSVMAEDEPYIKEIKVNDNFAFSMSHPPAIGDASQKFMADTIMSDGTIAEGDEYKDMIWRIERYDNVNETYTTVQTGEGDRIYFWQPYGTKEGQYKVTATSKVDPDASGDKWYQLHYPWYTETFCIFYPGTVKYGKVTTASGRVANQKHKKAIRAKDMKETYDWDTKKYTCILPESPYKAKDYTFAGWKKIDGKDDKKVFRPGAEYVSPARDSDEAERNAYFQAQWKPNFKNPDLVVNKAGKKKIKLSWNRMIGGKGYKVYRAAKKNGRYRMVKTIKNKWKTAWTDKKVKAKKKYYYKVAAYKKGSQKKSAWALTSTKAAKVKSVKLSKASVKGIVGKTGKIKATVKTAKGKKLSKKVRWYTSDKKIAKINSKGKITFVRKGTCQIWAKAYNGKDSSKIKVTVK